jgi:hypothetical protein
MAEYRIYRVDRHGRAFGVTALSFADDSEAAAYVEQRCGEGQSFELWQGQRLLGRYGEAE